MVDGIVVIEGVADNPQGGYGKGGRRLCSIWTDKRQLYGVNCHQGYLVVGSDLSGCAALVENLKAQSYQGQYKEANRAEPDGRR